MISRLFPFFIVPAIFFCMSCNNQEFEYAAEQIELGYMECFPKKTLNEDNSPVSCELSGVAYYHDSVFFVSDKRIPGTSSLFGGPFEVPFKRRDFTHYGGKHVVNARKMEDMAVSPNQDYMFITTGFDRVKSKPTSWDYYNMLIIRDLTRNIPEKLAFSVKREERESSLKLRRMIKNALRSRLYPEGAPYFKVGGIAVTHDNYFLIGIREIGSSYRKGDFENTITILGAKYRIEGAEMKFTSELKVIYRFDYEENTFIKEKIGLSGLEYDVYNKRLFILTSYEHGDSDEQVGGYLWVLPLKDFFLNNPPSYVRKRDGTPLNFAHKSEGVTVLSPHKVLIIHDDDRIKGSEYVTDARKQFKRKLNQAAFTVLYFPE